MASFGRLARAAVTQASRGLQQRAWAQGNQIAAQNGIQARSFAAGIFSLPCLPAELRLCMPSSSMLVMARIIAPGGGHGHDHGVTFAGLTMHKPSGWHVYGGKAFAGLMW
jgi:hypothetical protein